MGRSSRTGLGRSVFTIAGLKEDRKNYLQLSTFTYLHTLYVNYVHAPANLNSRYSKYMKVARAHYFCTIALRPRERIVHLHARRMDSFTFRVTSWGHQPVLFGRLKTIIFYMSQGWGHIISILIMRRSQL